MNNSTIGNVTDIGLGSTPNEIILNYFSVQSGIPLGETIIFWLVVSIFGFVIYNVLSMFTDFNKSTIIILSCIPLFIFDSILPFGTYVFVVPFIDDIVLTQMVMTLSLVDWIFGFQLFNPALDIMAKYAVIEGDPLTAGIGVMIVTGLFSIGDSILQFVIFAMACYYFISLGEDKARQQFSLQIPVSIIGGLIPVILYAFYFSNPIHEFQKANIQIASLIHFMDVAPLFDKSIVVTLGIISFFIVLIIMSVITRFFLSTAISVIPSMQQQVWMTSYGAVAFLNTLIYTFLYIMHPDYKWYIILGVIITWKAFRHIMEDVSHEAKGRTKAREDEKRKIAMIVHEIKHPSTNDERIQPHIKHKTIFNIEIILGLIGLVIILFGFLIITGFI